MMTLQTGHARAFAPAHAANVRSSPPPLDRSTKRRWFASTTLSLSLATRLGARDLLDVARRQQRRARNARASDDEAAVRDREIEVASRARAAGGVFCRARPRGPNEGAHGHGFDAYGALNRPPRGRAPEKRRHGRRRSDAGADALARSSPRARRERRRLEPQQRVRALGVGIRDANRRSASAPGRDDDVDARRDHLPLKGVAPGPGDAAVPLRVDV